MSVLEKHTEEYRRRIASKQWRELRRSRIQAAQFKCERCGSVRLDWSAFELHHLTYERLGHERPEDLQVVCKGCHASADEERAVVSRRRSSNALWRARLDGWATKIYGEDWHLGNVEAIEEEFEEWLEAQD